MEVNSESAEEICKKLYDAIYGGQKEGDNYRVAAAVMILKEDGSLEKKIMNRKELGD